MTPEDHALLAACEKGTPMGALLRRYWQPACLSTELEADGAPLRVKLLGEDLIAFRDSEGGVGLLREHCAHRGASLYFARNGNARLTCWYHGWAWDIDGNCLDQPNMPKERRFCDKVRQPAYKCIERNGVVWSYLGPQDDIPPLHELEWLTVPESHVYVSKRIQACHWTQCIEGDMDPSHLPFLHTDAILESTNHGPAESGNWLKDDLMPRVEIEETEAGFIVAGRRQAGPDDYFWRIGQWFFPNFTTIPAFPGAGPLMGHSWTPMEFDRTAVYTFIWHPARPLGAEELARVSSNTDMHARLMPGTFLPLANASNEFAAPGAPEGKQPWMRIKPFQDQDMAATCSMGPLYDRTQENLCVQDAAVVNYRRRLIDAARALEAGRGPPGRDPKAYRLRPVSVKLPRATNSWARACAEAMDARPETFRASV